MLGKKEKKTDKEKIEEVLPTEESEAVPKEPKGNFSLTAEEMELAVQALADRPELKVYNDFIVGERIAHIIQAYKAAIENKEELPKGDEEPETQSSE